ncbi:general substrate transporter [Mycena olivaceomarginata]|nr:general substrate transporter [Mycena olivaceomarginata]
MLNNIRILPQWNDYFDNPQGSNLGLLALYSIGSIASLPILPFIADRFGRKVAIIGRCILMIIAAGIQGASQNLAMFKGARFLMGSGNSMAQLSAPLLLTELCHPQHRGRVTAIYNCLWNLGSIVNTWLTFGTRRIPSTWSWRIPTIIQGGPSAIQLLFIFFIPESPRWLISKNRPEEALGILAKYHANGNANDATVQFEYAEMKETLRLEFQYKKTSSYFDFLKTRGNRYRLLLIISLGLFPQWSGNGLVSYYATNVYDSVGITSPNSQLGINGGLSILSLIVSVTFALLCDRSVLLSIKIREINACAGRAVIAFIWLFSVSYALAWSGLLVAYTVEIMPFKIRAKVLMVMNLWIQVALVINQYVNLLGFQHLNPNWKFYTTYTFELVLIYIFYVETTGPTLEEIARIFDGERLRFYLGVWVIYCVKATLILTFFLAVLFARFRRYSRWVC